MVFKYWNIDEKMKYLFISAHPDDLEFSAANLIRYLSRKKHDVEILSLTRGEFGSYSPEEVGTNLATRKHSFRRYY